LNPPPIKSAGLSPRQTITDPAIKKEPESVNAITTDLVTMVCEEINNKTSSSIDSTASSEMEKPKRRTKNQRPPDNSLSAPETQPERAAQKPISSNSKDNKDRQNARSKKAMVEEAKVDTKDIISSPDIVSSHDKISV
jgi:hypothetical protein